MGNTKSTHILCSIVFMFGILVGSLIHGHILLHDVVSAIIAGGLFSVVNTIPFRLCIQRVLETFNSSK